MTIDYMGRTWTYEDVCARWDGKCYETAMTKLSRIIEEIRQPGGEDMTWPMHIAADDDGNYEEIFLAQALGSPTIRADDEKVIDAKYLKSTFYLRDDGELNKLM